MLVLDSNGCGCPINIVLWYSQPAGDEETGVLGSRKELQRHSRNSAESSIFYTLLVVTCGGGIEGCRSGCLGVEELEEYLNECPLFFTRNYII